MLQWHVYRDVTFWTLFYLFYFVESTESTAYSNCLSSRLLPRLKERMESPCSRSVLVFCSTNRLFVIALKKKIN